LLCRCFDEDDADDASEVERRSRQRQLPFRLTSEITGDDADDASEAEDVVVSKDDSDRDSCRLYLPLRLLGTQKYFAYPTEVQCVSRVFREIGKLLRLYGLVDGTVVLWPGIYKFGL
jgi:hypothetical protein